MLTQVFFCKRSQVSLWNKVRRMRPRGKSFIRGVCLSVCMCVRVCAYLYMHFGSMEGFQMKPIYILNMPLFIGELQHHSVLLTALAYNWLTALNVSGLDCLKRYFV